MASEMPLFEQVKRHVRDGIRAGTYPIGSVLPPIEEIAAAQSCSEGTVRRALTDLAQQGVVNRIQRRGTVVMKEPGLGRVCLTLAPDAHTNLLLQEPFYQALTEEGFDVDIVPSAQDPVLMAEHIRRIYDRERASLSLVAIEPDWLPLKDEKARQLVDSLPMRVVFTLDNHPALPGYRILSLDHREAARLVVSHLLELGHRDVGVLGGMWPEERGNWVNESAIHARHLLEVAGAECHMFYLSEGPEKRSIELVRQEGVTAFWLINDNIGVMVVNAMHRAGIRIPEDVSIIGRHDTPWSRECTPTLTTVTMGAQAAALAAVDMLKDPAKASSEGETTTLVLPELLLRDSTGPATAS